MAPIRDDLTRAQLEAHRAIYRQMAFYRKHFPGFAGASVSSIAGQVGVRESRRIHGEYMLTNEDVLSHRKFSDAVARSNYPIDVHGHKLRNQEIVSEENTAPYYEIPYRCMVPVGVDGLLVAGRCISSEFVAQSSLRIQPTARALGEAAGIAAAMAVRRWERSARNPRRGCAGGNAPPWRAVLRNLRHPIFV